MAGDEKTEDLHAAVAERFMRWYEGDIFRPDWGFPVGGWVRKFAWTRVKTEDHGYIRWKLYYRRPIRMYSREKGQGQLVYQNVHEIDA